MSLVSKPYNFPPLPDITTPILSTEINADFDILYSDYNGNIDDSNIAVGANITYDKLVTMSGDATITAGGVITVTGSGSGFIPVGTVIPFYDFNGTLTFNTSLWRYCDGSVLAYPGSPIDGLTLPDLSGRYIVGFGTDGGGDIGTAPWATAAVGNASHQINIQHDHTGPSHTHDMANHTHTGPSHTHDMANHTHTIGSHTHPLSTNGYAFVTNSTVTGTDYIRYERVTGLTAWGGNYFTISADAGASVGGTSTTATALGGDTDASSGSSGTPSTNITSADGTGATSVPSTNTTSANGTGNTSTALSTTQSIQPHSIRMRYLIKVI